MLDNNGHMTDRGGLSRREVLQRGAAGALLLGTGTLLAACGTSPRSAAAGASAASGQALPLSSGGGAPVRGGTLRLGAITGGSSETLDPLYGLSVQDSIRSLQIFEGLFAIGVDTKTLVPTLATGAEPNKDGSVWIVHLRKGVMWHDGKPFTADDALYSIRRWGASSSPMLPVVAGIDLKAMRKRDSLTVEIPLTAPSANLPALLAQPVFTGMIPNGATPDELRAAPVGTGPFKFKSFEPGRRSEFVRNENYWQHGKPYVDTLVIDSSFTDENARVNALLAGALDLIPQAGYLVAKQQLAAGNVTVFGSPTSTAWNFPMRVDKGPLADVRVRQALRLVADRQALIDGALAGFGVPANDLVGMGSDYYASDLKRNRDVEQAKFLLKAAGRQNLQITLQTSPVADGFVQAATLFAQQAKAAGVSVNVKTIPPATYFTPAGGYMSAPFRTTFYSPAASLEGAYRGFLMPGGQDDSGWGLQAGGKQSLAQMEAAFAELDAAKANERWRAVQQQQFDEGGLLAWSNAAVVDLASSKVKGLREGPVGFVNNGRLLDGWLATH